MEENSEVMQQIIYFVFYITLGAGVLGAVLIIIGVSCIFHCKKLKCRYLTYVACALLYVIGIISFVLTIAFSILTPGSYYFCAYL